MQDIITTSNSGLSRQALKHQADRQKIVRLFHGVYIDAEKYAALDVAGKYRARANAFLATHPRLKPWGITAAALEGAPVLLGAPLHFSGTRNYTRSRQEGCLFHEALPPVPKVNNAIAQTLFECAISSPLADALLAGNHLLQSLTSNTAGELQAHRTIDEKTSEALIWSPLDSKSARVKAYCTFDAAALDTSKPGFLNTYLTARNIEFTSPEAELAWLGFAQLCVAFGTKRAIRKALNTGAYFTDQAESPAESLLIARCVELGFSIPRTQVNIINPASGKHMGRVDGLWPSNAVLKGLYQSDSKYGRQLYCNQYGDNDSVIIEFDGRQKYQQDYFDALDKERTRQNAISNLGFRFIRIDWDDLMQPEQLRSILKAVKVPRLRQG